MRITRRHLLALTAATAAVGTLGVAITVRNWWDQPADAPYVTLTAEEARFVRAWAGVAYPRTAAINLDGDRANLDRFFDALIMRMADEPRKLLKLLLNALDNGSRWTHGARFAELSLADREAAFADWIVSDQAEFRTALQALTLLLGMGWSIHPAVAPTMQRLHSCGYGP
jgi:hypothetical protein